MPTEFVTQLPALTAVLEKLGVIGVLVLVVGWLIWERLRLVKLGAKTFRQRDMARHIAERYRGAIVALGAAVPDISDILKEYAADAED